MDASAQEVLRGGQTADLVGQQIHLLPPPFKKLYVGLQTVIWIADLAFLLTIARHDKRTRAFVS